MSKLRYISDGDKPVTEEYKKCILNKGAAKDVENSTREACLALITDDNRIVHVFSPGTIWTKAKEGAKFFDTGYGWVVCDVAFEVLPYYRTYRPLSELSSTNTTQHFKSKSENFVKFSEMELMPLADKKFEANNSTNFLGIKVQDTIIKVFPRGTSIDQISNLSLMLEGDIVLVKAKAQYTITGLAKIEKTYEQLRHN